MISATKISLDTNAYCISCDQVRYSEFCKNFSKAGFSKFPMPINDRNLSKEFLDVFYPNASPKPHAMLCGYNHYKIIKEAIRLNLPYVVVYEDDAYPCDHIKDRFKYYTEQLDRSGIDWGCLVVGRAGISCPEFDIAIKQGNFIEAKGKLHGSHAYVVKQEYYEMALSRFSWWRTIGKYGAAADFTLCYPPLRSICTLESLFMQKNGSCFIVPERYDRDYLGKLIRTEAIPRGYSLEVQP